MNDREIQTTAYIFRDRSLLWRTGKQKRPLNQVANSVLHWRLLCVHVESDARLKVKHTNECLPGAIDKVLVAYHWAVVYVSIWILPTKK